MFILSWVILFGFSSSEVSSDVSWPLVSTCTCVSTSPYIFVGPSSILYFDVLLVGPPFQNNSFGELMESLHMCRMINHENKINAAIVMPVGVMTAWHAIS